MKVLNFVKKALVFWSLVGMVLFAACTDITDIIGGGFVPGNSDMHLNITDTVTLETYSILRDSVFTSENETYLLGSINDPVFGKTTASIYARYIFVGGFDTAFHEAEFFDSLVLNIDYSGYYYGDTLVPQTINVYEITENISDTNYYYSNQIAAYNPVPLATYTYTPNPNPEASIDYDEEEYEDTDPPPQIHIKLATSPNENQFVSELMKIRFEDYSVYDDSLDLDQILDEDFYNEYYGIYITVEPVNIGRKGALIGTNLYGINSALQFYKRDTTHGANNTIINIGRPAKLLFSSTNGLVYNNYDHDNYNDATSEFQDQVIYGDKTMGEEKLYLQSLGGTHLRVKFPHLQNLKELGYKIAINKAELVFSVATDNYEAEAFEAPPEIGIQVQYENDSIFYLPDYAHGSNFIGGELDTTNKINNDYKYKFRITRYIQEVLDKENEGELGLYLFASPESNVYHRAVFYGNNPDDPDSEKAAKLILTYTIIDD